MKTRKPLDEMTDSAVLAMALDDMEFLGLIKLKSDKKPTVDENREVHGHGQASSALAA